MSESGETQSIEEFTRDDKKKRRKITWIIVLCAVTAMVLISVWRYQLKTTITSDNAKVAGDIVDISSRLSGQLDRLLVKEQDIVKSGQAVAQLDSYPYKIALDQAKASLDIAEADYDKLPTDVKSMQAAYARAQEIYEAAAAKAKTYQISMEDARRNLEHNESLYQQGAISRETMDSSNSRYNSALANMEMEQANAQAAMASLQDAEAKKESMTKTGSIIYIAKLKQAQAVYESAKFNFENTTMKAPFAATVVRIVVQEKENIAASQVILSICDLKNVWLTANIDESKIARVKKGQDVDIKIDAYPGQKFKGRVEAIGNATQSSFSLLPTENSSGNFTKVMQRIPIKISVVSEGQILKPGMSAYIKIHTGN
ncbi:MAG: HlyD family secretion protein [Syntrophomonadaceae bacterium]|nr:HlyD family secretion protein [Syntrophomonadaceae bacterium]